MAVGTVDKDAIRRAQADIVVTVKAVLWCDALEHCGHVAEQRWIVLVDDEGSRRVKSLNVDDAGPDLRCFDKSADLVGQAERQSEAENGAFAGPNQPLRHRAEIGFSEQSRQWRQGNLRSARLPCDSVQGPSDERAAAER